jgi:YbgC/YbaW family acyl-CoA thioester hydrolase
MNVEAAHGALVRQHVVRRPVEHSDIDGYGVVHFARYAAFAETAALALLEKIGLGIERLQESGIELRVRELSLKYRAAATFADTLLVEAHVDRIGIAHLHVGVRILREREDPEPTLVDGKLDMALIDSKTRRPIPVPRT